jgi:CubicO group peptidase (beta-lactamase class C family)
LLVKDAGRSITFEHLFTMTSGIPYSGPDSYSSRTFDEELSRLGEGLTTMKAAAALLPRWAMRDVTVLCCWVAASWTGNVFCPGRPWN